MRLYPRRFRNEAFHQEDFLVCPRLESEWYEGWGAVRCARTLGVSMEAMAVGSIGGDGQHSPGHSNFLPGSWEGKAIHQRRLHRTY